MKSNINFSEASSLLLSHDNILIITHRNPDGDTLGSSSALCRALRRAGKNAFLFRNPQITDKYYPYVAPLLATEDFHAEYIVSVDVPAEDMFSKGFSGKSIDLCIDHHPSNPGFGTQNLICAEKSACGEIILKVITEMHRDISREEAELLYIAISTDTGCFQYSNTNSETFCAAAELLRCGIDNGKLNIKFFRKVSKARIRLESLIYSGMEYFRNGKIVVAMITREMIASVHAKEDDCEDLAGLVGRIDSEILGITIRETENGSCKVSLRSAPEIDCSAICAVFGGGGHKMASGCTINASPEKTKEMLLQVIDEVWK